jgi:hypothetical protein
MLTQRHLYDQRLIQAFLPLVLSGSGLLALSPAAFAQAGFALSPMRVETSAAPGTLRNGILSIGNDSKSAARFRVEILDVSIDRDAVPQFEADIPSESLYSCKQWMTVNPMEATMAPSSQMAVRYTLRIPDGIPPRTYHCALGFTSLPDAKQSQEGPIGITALIRMTTTFYLTVGNPTPTGQLKSITIEQVPGMNGKGAHAVFLVENSGLTNLRGAGKVDVLNEAGKTVQSAVFPTTVIFPSRTQRIPFVLKSDLPEGAYRILARVNLGTNEIQEATLEFRVPPAE